MAQCAGIAVSNGNQRASINLLWVIVRVFHTASGRVIGLSHSINIKIEYIKEVLLLLLLLVWTFSVDKQLNTLYFSILEC